MRRQALGGKRKAVSQAQVSVQIRQGQTDGPFIPELQAGLVTVSIVGCQQCSCAPELLHSSCLSDVAQSMRRATAHLVQKAAGAGSAERLAKAGKEPLMDFRVRGDDPPGKQLRLGTEARQSNVRVRAPVPRLA